MAKNKWWTKNMTYSTIESLVVCLFIFTAYNMSKFIGFLIAVGLFATLLCAVGHPRE